MKILVPIKRTIDANVKVRVNTDESGVDLNSTKMATNPFCEIAVEEAVRLKEQGVADEIVVVSIGDSKAQEQLKSVMAIGADRAIVITSERELESLNIAKILQKIVEQENPGLILLGKQSIDSDNNQVGQMLAALCGYPQGTFAYALTVDQDANQVIVDREIDGGAQRVALTLPAVVTTDLRLNEPRFAKLPDIMKAKKKPIETISAGSLGIDLQPRLAQLKVENPKTRSSCVMVQNTTELVDKLRNEAKVLS